VAGPTRSDARRNRTAILRAADRVLTRGTEPTPLPEIARLAGVGPATVYRHFNDRRTLAVAVMRGQVAALTDLVTRLEDDPRGFRCALQIVLSSQAAMRPLVALLTELPEGDQRRQAERLAEVLRPALERAQAAGLARPGATTTDLLMLFPMVEAAVQSAAILEDEDRRDATIARAINVLVDGMCTRKRP
jgi:AcrR family transcriptional regulator